MLDFIAVPFGYIMRLIYEIIGNYGLSIVAFTLLTKIILLPLAIKTKKGMVEIQRLQPKLKALEKKFGKDKEKYNMEVQKLYAEEKINPLGSCLPTLLTMPLMFGLYYVVSKPLTYFMGLKAAEISTMAGIFGIAEKTGGYGVEIEVAGKLWQNFDQVAHVSDKLMHVNFDFFGMNLAATPSFSAFNLLWIVPILSGLTAYLMSWVTKKMQGPQEPAAGGNMAALNIMMPLMSVYLGFILPAGLGIYWISNNVFSTIQEFLLSKFMFKAPPEELELPKKKKPKPAALAETNESKSDAENEHPVIIDGVEQDKKE